MPSAAAEMPDMGMEEGDYPDGDNQPILGYCVLYYVAILHIQGPPRLMKKLKICFVLILLMKK